MSSITKAYPPQWPWATQGLEFWLNLSGLDIWVMVTIFKKRKLRLYPPTSEISYSPTSFLPVVWRREMAS